MKTTFMRLTAFVAAGAVASLGLAACSANSGSASNESAEATATSDGAVQIEYWHRLPDKDGMIKVSESADEWNKAHPSIHVKAIKFEGSADDANKKISAAVKAGNAPCLAQAAYNHMPSMLVHGELMDVTADAAQYQNNYAAGTWAEATPGGKAYGLPQDAGPLVYYYDKDAFEKLGLKAPTTWDEYWANAAKAKAAGKFTSVFLKDDAGDWFSSVVAANGSQWYAVEGDAWKIDINGATSKKVADTWQKSIDEGTTLATDRWGDPAPFDQALKEGKIIGYLGATWEAAFNLGPLGKDKANWAVAQVPGDITGSWGGSAIVVLKGCKYPKQALEFANWYNINLKAMASQGLVPAAKGTVPTPDEVKALYGGADIMPELMKAAERTNAKWTYSPTWPAVKKLLQDNIGKKMTLSANLDACQAEAVKTLEGEGLKVVK